MAGTFMDTFLPALTASGGKAGVGALQGMLEGPQYANALKRQGIELDTAALMRDLHKYQVALERRKALNPYSQIGYGGVTHQNINPETLEPFGDVKYIQGNRSGNSPYQFMASFMEENPGSTHEDALRAWNQAFNPQKFASADQIDALTQPKVDRTVAQTGKETAHGKLFNAKTVTEGKHAYLYGEKGQTEDERQALLKKQGITEEGRADLYGARTNTEWKKPDRIDSQISLDAARERLTKQAEEQKRKINASGGGKALGPTDLVIAKVAREGVESLTPGELAIWDRWSTGPGGGESVTMEPDALGQPTVKVKAKGTNAVNKVSEAQKKAAQVIAKAREMAQTGNLFGRGGRLKAILDGVLKDADAIERKALMDAMAREGIK